VGLLVSHIETPKVLNIKMRKSSIDIDILTFLFDTRSSRLTKRFFLYLLIYSRNRVDGQQLYTFPFTGHTIQLILCVIIIIFHKNVTDKLHEFMGR
jgi:hypothetical protein